jgi:hypothetical protein
MHYGLESVYPSMNWPGMKSVPRYIAEGADGEARDYESPEFKRRHIEAAVGDVVMTIVAVRKSNQKPACCFCTYLFEYFWAYGWWSSDSFRHWRGELSHLNACREDLYQRSCTMTFITDDSPPQGSLRVVSLALTPKLNR